MTDYDALYDEIAAQVPEDAIRPVVVSDAPETSYDALYDEITAAQDAAARGSLELAQRHNPDRAGRAIELARKTGIPVDVVSARMESVHGRHEASRHDMAQMRVETPELYARLARRDFVTAAHDDIDALADIERWGKGAGYAFGAGATARLGAGLFDVSSVIADAFSVVVDPLTPGDAFAGIASDLRFRAGRAREAIEHFRPAAHGMTERAFMSGFESAGQNLALMPLAFSALGRSAGAAGSALAGAMSGLVGAEAYTDKRSAGGTIPAAGMYGLSEGLIEYAMEKIPADQLFKAVAGKRGFIKTLGQQLVTEGVTEQATTFMQDLNEWVNMNPSASLQDYVNARPEAAYQTFVATLVGTTVQTSAVAGAQKLADKAYGMIAAADDAQQRAQWLQDGLNRVAKAKLHQRSPTTLREFVDSVAVGQPEFLFVDSDVLEQSSREMAADEFLRILPTAAKALEDGAMPGGMVAIPLSEIMANAPGTALEGMLVEHSRTTEDGLSLAEAKQEGEQAGAFIRDEAARVLQDAADQDSWQASHDAVRDILSAQIVATGRKSKDVADAVAEFGAQFFSVMASRHGVTPGAMYEKYPLRFGADVSQGGAQKRTLGQGGDAGIPDGAYVSWSVANETYFDDEGDEVDGPEFVLIEKVFVPEGSRKKGVGRAILREALREIQENHPDLEVKLSAYPLGVGKKAIGLSDLVAFYESEGFVAGESPGDAVEMSFDGRVRGPPALLSQPATDGSSGPRGAYNPDALIIALGPKSNLSTALHEMGHFFLEVMSDLAGSDNAPAEIVADMAVLLQWFGVPDLAAWQAMTLDEKRTHHEKFAEGFEQYLFEGKAPTQDLQLLFRRFAAWMKSVYQALHEFIGSRDIGLNDEVRQVLDRMLATEDQIRAAEDRSGLSPDEGATATAIEALQARSLRDLRWSINAKSKALKRLQKEVSDLRKAAEKDAAAEVALRPIYRAMRFLKKGELTNERGDPVDVPKGQTTKIDVDALAAMYPDPDAPAPLWRMLPSGRFGVVGKEGLHPDIVAGLFGFDDAYDLVAGLAGITPIKEAIKDRADQIMLERHGDVATPEAMELAALDAVHNEARARSLASELVAQEAAIAARESTGRTASNGRAITVNAMVAAAQRFADSLTGSVTVKALKSTIQMHRAAEAKAAKRWSAATKKADTQAALQAKRDQLLHHAVVASLIDAQSRTNKTLDGFRKYAKGGMKRAASTGRDPAIVSMIRVIMGAYGLAERQAETAADYLRRVADNDPQTAGILGSIAQPLLDNAKQFGLLSIEDLGALSDALASLWVMAETVRSIEIDGKAMSIDDAAGKILARMAEKGIPATIPGELSAITEADEARTQLQFSLAFMTRVEQWAEWMDGAWGGPFLRLIFQPIKEAADRYRDAREEFHAKYQAMIDRIAPLLSAAEIAAPELNYTFGAGRQGGHAELLHAILHTGNDSNRRKLLLGRWANPALMARDKDAAFADANARWEAFMSRMYTSGVIKKDHMDFVQSVWDLMEETKALAQATHRKVYGRFFDEVTAQAFVTPFGQYAGGYAPALADPRMVADAALRKMAETENEAITSTLPQTAKGFTKNRTEAYVAPLLLDIRSVSQHLDKVLLFSHMEGAVTDVRRLLMRRDVSAAVSRAHPSAYTGLIIPWLDRAAKQRVETPILGDGKVSGIARNLRKNAGMALMFANVSNTAQQVTGFSTAAIKVSPALMRQATAVYLSSPSALVANVFASSSYMKHRLQSEVNAMNAQVEAILINPTTMEQARAWTDQHAYFMQTGVDYVMSPIIWTAAFNQSVAGGMNNTDAVRFADGVIRQTQGSMLPEDVSRIETGNAFARLFTQFMGYFIMTANTSATAILQVHESLGLGSIAGSRRALVIAMYGVMLPIWVATAIAVAFKGGPEDEDDDGYLDDWLSQVLGIGTIRGLTGMVPAAGPVAQMVANRFNDNPADDRMSLSPALSLVEMAASAPASVIDAVADDGSAQKALRDSAALATLLTGLPIYAGVRPIGYAAGMAEGRIEPASAGDMVRGLITGTASPESKRP